VKQTWADLKGDGVLQPPVPADRGRGKERKGGGRERKEEYRKEKRRKNRRKK
jgi:hypothetical protein